MRSSGMPVFVAENLGEDGVGSGADVLRAAANAEAAIGAKLDRRGAGQAQGNPACAGQPPAENLAVAAHRADGWSALVPAEFFRAELRSTP